MAVCWLRCVPAYLGDRVDSVQIDPRGFLVRQNSILVPRKIRNTDSCPYFMK
jgi:hypothetical protein